jgi:pimeloyl-ACP methyl ester carboxylesterase
MSDPHLATRTEGAPTARPTLVIVPGLFGSARNWGAIARNLSADRRVVAVDMRNHGDSFRAPTQGYAEMAGDLERVIGGLGAPVDVLGHSMGGKAAMVLALTHGAMVRRLVVADIAPVAYAHTQAHLVRAMMQMDLTGLTRRSESDRRLASAVEDPATRAFLLQSLDLSADPPRWKLNLPVLLQDMEAITGWPGVTGRFAGEALFLTGAQSHYVRPEHRPAIHALFPRAHFASLPGAGHWLHADRPREFEAAVRVFLDRDFD